MSTRLPFRSLLAALACAVPGIARGQTAELTELHASGGAALDFFGRSVSLAGDRALVGALGDDELGSSAGAAYVFERDPAGAWSQAAKLLASDGSFLDSLGYSVSLFDDRALLGARMDGDNGPSSGSAYVFERQGGGTWTQASKILAPDGAVGDIFGHSVSLEGDRALIGAPGDDSSRGSASVFERGPGIWVFVAKLRAASGLANDHFGLSVALAGDRALVGAPTDDFTGSAFVFERQSNGTWLEMAKLVASDRAFFDGLGASVSLSGDRAIVGADGAPGSGRPGAAYVFERQPNGTWLETAKLVASNGIPSDRFGCSVSLVGDRAVVGASRGALFGLAYEFERGTGGQWTEVARLSSSDATGEFGASVSLSGDRVLVGASTDSDQGASAGSAYAFDLLPLSGAVTQLSLTGGGSQPLELDAGHLHAGESYLLLGSMSGTSPGIPIGGGFVLPLDPDRYFTRTLEFPNRPPLTNSRGALNAAGHADATFSIIPLDPQLAGVTVHHAFVTLGAVLAASTGSSSSPAPSPALATFVSNPFPLRLMP